LGSRPDIEVRLWPKEKNEKTDVCYVGAQLFDDLNLLSSRSRETGQYKRSNRTGKPETSNRQQDRDRLFAERP
jgi:hypothetical protein